MPLSPPAQDLPISLLLVPHRHAGEHRSAETMRRTLEVIEQAVGGGFHACFLPEHHLREDDYVTSPLTVAAYVAGRWPEARVATSVVLPALHNPLLLAEQLATLDVVSGGRLYCVGVGLGDVRAEFDALGVPYSEMLARYTGAIDALRRLWAGERVSADLGTLQLREARLSPDGVQPELPLALGAMSDAGVTRAARLGLPWITDPMHPLERLEEWAERYWSRCGGRGRIILMRQAWIAPTVADAEREWWPHAREQIVGFSLVHDRLRGEAGLGPVATVDDLRFEHFASRFLLGPPSDVIVDATQMAARLGASDVVVRMGFGTGPDHGAVLDAVGALGRALRARGDGPMSPPDR